MEYYGVLMNLECDVGILKKKYEAVDAESQRGGSIWSIVYFDMRYRNFENIRGC